MKQKVKLLVGKVSALVIGVCVTITAYGISKGDENVYKFMRTFTGSIVGSILGIYVLGIFTPWATPKGAICGGMVGYMFMLWIFFGANFFATGLPRSHLAPTSIENCPVTGLIEFNATTFNTAEWVVTTAGSNSTAVLESSPAEAIYHTSFHLYVLFGSVVTITFGLIISFITGHQKASESNPKLFLPIVSNSRLPKAVVKFFRFGVPENNEKSDLSPKKYEMKPLKEESEEPA